MTTHFVMYNGKHVGLRLMSDGKHFVKTRKRSLLNRYGDKDVCPLCKKPFLEENVTSVVLMISNQAGIPNRFIHSECMEDKTPEYAVQLVAEDFEAWKKAQKDHPGWSEIVCQQ